MRAVRRGGAVVHRVGRSWRRASAWCVLCNGHCTKRATAKERATAAQTRSIRDGRVIVRKELGTTERFPRLALCPRCHLGLCPLVLLILDLARHHFHFPYRATLRFGAFSMSTAVSAGSESVQGRRHYPLYGASGLRGMKKVISLGTRTGLSFPLVQNVICECHDYNLCLRPGTQTL